MLADHVRDTWDQHVAAAGGTAFAVINGVAILQSVIVGLILFVLTSALKWLARRLSGYLTGRR